MGADVPFFIIGGRCECKGIGDRIKKIGARDEQYILIKLLLMDLLYKL